VDVQQSDVVLEASEDFAHATVPVLGAQDHVIVHEHNVATCGSVEAGVVQRPHGIALGDHDLVQVQLVVGNLLAGEIIFVNGQHDFEVVGIGGRLHDAGQ